MNPIFLIASLLLFLFKKPQYAILVLIIGFAVYYFGGGEGESTGGAGQEIAEQLFGTGLSMTEEEYYKAEVFEPLAASSKFNQLPRKVTLEQYAPSRRHQGRQGSCVGWASAYGAQTVLYSLATGQQPNQIAFSPAYLYNQIALENCQGAYLVHALQVMKNEGLLPFSEFGYDERSCGRLPSSTQQRAANQYRIRGYNRLSQGARNYSTDLLAIKQNLAQGAPVVIGMEIPQSFMYEMEGRQLWKTTRQDLRTRTFGGHAMCVIGYDDDLAGGAFQIMNSWGQEWGNRGLAWVPYEDFQQWVREAYGLYPMGQARKADPNRMEVAFGLVDMGNEVPLEMVQTGDYIFRTARPVRKGDRLKILTNNSVECYIYVFGEETDGSSYVLFPYTEKHSPYCGITGTRLFPKEESLVPDEIGNKDRIAVVVTQAPVDYQRLNAAINASTGRSYAQKVGQAIADQRIPNVTFSAGQTISFKGNTSGKNAVGIVIEIDKI